MTTLDLLQSAMRLLGIIAPEETPSPSEVKDSTDALNALLESWNAQHLAIYNVVNTQYQLVAGTGSYTMGTGGTINVPRPMKIQSAGIIQFNGLRGDLELVNSRDYALIREKSAQAVEPLKLYNDNAYPLATLNLWPVPKADNAAHTATLDLTVWNQFLDATYRYYTDLVLGAGGTTATSAANPFTSADIGHYLNITDQSGAGFTVIQPPLRVQITGVSGSTATLSGSAGTAGSTAGAAIYDTALALPPGYTQTLRYALAFELSAEWGKPVPQDVAMIAQGAKQQLMALNASNNLAIEDLPPAPPAAPAQQ
jgi:hypothetical protein